MDKTRILNKAKNLYIELNTNKSSLTYEDQAKLAREGMALLWPRIRELEVDLNVFKELHMMFQTIHYDVKRHCVDITHLAPEKKKTSRPRKNEVASLIKSIKGLSEEQIRTLKKRLDKTEEKK
jgi:hypothetical protein